MPADVLTLGGITFDDFSTPEAMPGGGHQWMVVHKLPGGNRVIDTLGPDEADVRWHGQFFGDNAYSTALQLDAMRAAGQVLPLTWGGQFRSVIIKSFIYEVRRMPVLVDYRVSCTVYQNPSLGLLGVSTGSIDDLVLSDISLALSQQ
jgi:hypothetical protein